MKNIVVNTGKIILGLLIFSFTVLIIVIQVALEGGIP